MSDLMDACHLALFMEQYLSFNENHFCIYFMEVFEQFLSRGYTNGPVYATREWPRVICLPPYSPFLNPIEHLLSKWKNIEKATSPRSETDLFNQVAQEKLLLLTVMAIIAIC
ncbi:hypothetical protein RF11_10284 [Thelohanellus kitauei]|uniref:Tc1-like transposase DDE domain-containing protein n=1 Tax=Thelohanellus kitauei TaxID=669202 RepID=A0A0C2N178_THEKT|nr:hypothetical protein RF11_10284 [Thelohanellus kitauei]